MNYLKRYVKLMRRALTTPTTNPYTEKHHIFPTSIFGDNDFTVTLSYREHFIAHWLLYRAFINRYGIQHGNTIKMGMAVHRMVFASKNKEVVHTSRMFEVARMACVLSKTGIARQDMKGKRYFGATEEVARAGIEKMRLKKTGMKIDYPQGRKSPPCSKEKASKISKSRLSTKTKYTSMSIEEFTFWVNSHKLYAKDGRINPNISRAIEWRGESIEQYYKE